MEYCIVYLSSSKGLLTEDELNTILEQSRKKNSDLGITGILLYYDGSIIQALEGPEETVKALYETIRQDQRHGYIMKLVSQGIEKRSFGDWSMAFKPLTAAQSDHLSQIGNDQNGRPLDFTGGDSPVLGLIQTFYKTNFRPSTSHSGG